MGKRRDRIRLYKEVSLLIVQYEKIKVGDRLVCNVLSNYGVIPVEHIVTKIDFLDMYGIRLDINKEVEILGASILEHKVSHDGDSYV